MIDLGKIPNIVLYDMFREGKEVNFIHFLTDLEKKLAEKEENYNKTIEKMEEENGN